MKWLKKALRTLVSWIADLFRSEDARKNMEQRMATVAEIARIAYPLVERVAALTPTRADDEILAAANELGVPLLLDPAADRSQVLRDIVQQALLRKVLPALSGSSVSLINAAIELAVQLLKANVESETA